MQTVATIGLDLRNQSSKFMASMAKARERSSARRELAGSRLLPPPAAGSLRDFAFPGKGDWGLRSPAHDPTATAATAPIFAKSGFGGRAPRQPLLSAPKPAKAGGEV
jgi:hypothetical protein